MANLNVIVFWICFYLNDFHSSKKSIISFKISSAFKLSIVIFFFDTASYKLTDSQTDSIINALDVSDVLDISSGLNTSPTNKQKVSADTNSDGQINALDVSNVLDLSSGLDNSGATAVLRDASASNPFSASTFAVSSGSDLTLSAYVLGDMNGTYADIL